MTAHAERAHAILGASSAYRWMTCPGSVRLSAGIDGGASDYARLGTAAHELAELCLRQGRSAEEFTGRQVGGFEVDADMAEAVQTYLDYVRAITKGKVCALDGDVEALNTAPELIVWIEKRFDLRAWARQFGLDAELFGTNDLAIYHPETRALEIIDYKHGQGVAVEAAGNPQLRYYALGAMMALQEAGYPVAYVKATVVQPRAPHREGPIRSEEVDMLDLLDWSADLLDAARATMQPDAPLSAGSHCRFCPASGQCPAQASTALAVAEMEFSRIEAALPPDPATLTPAQIGTILDRADLLDEWLSAVKQHAHTLLEQGVEVPGFKLVAKRATRQWADEDAAVGAMEVLGVEPYERKTLSPAKAEAALKDKGIKAAAAKDALSHLVVSVSSGTTLARDADKRPAVTPGAAGFTAITS